MSTNVKTVPTATSADAAYELMRRHGIHHLVVMDGNRPIGVVSERDLGGKKGAGVRRGVTVDEVMTPQVVSTTPDATIRQVANLLRGRGIGCLPVMEGGKLKGIITTSDLLAVIGRGAEKPRRRTDRPILRRKMGGKP